jgi:hypothetical protein
MGIPYMEHGCDDMDVVEFYMSPMPQVMKAAIILSMA